MLDEDDFHSTSEGHHWMGHRAVGRMGFSQKFPDRVRTNFIESELREQALRVRLDHDLPTFKTQVGKFRIPGPCHAVPSGLQL